MSVSSRSSAPRHSVPRVDDVTRPLPPEALAHLENGGVILIGGDPAGIPDDDRQFLLGLPPAAPDRNIAYRPKTGRVSGVARGTDAARLQAIMRRFSIHAAVLVGRLVPGYAAAWRVDEGSFRPVQERARGLRPRARHDLLHFDAFPGRPTNGDRLLRFFCNLNPTEERIWIMSDPFEVVVGQVGRTPQLLRLLDEPPPIGRRLLAALGVQPAQAPYDRFMLGFRDALKDDVTFQRTCVKHRLTFPPGSGWLVFGDMASHAVVSGQFALEQTFVVSRAAMADPGRAPAATLERLCGHAVTLGGT